MWPYEQRGTICSREGPYVAERDHMYTSRDDMYHIQRCIIHTTSIDDLHHS